MPNFEKLTFQDMVTIIAFLLSAGIMYGSVSARISTIEEKTKQYDEVITSMHGIREQLIRLESKLGERAISEERLERKMERLEESLHYGQK